MQLSRRHFIRLASASAATIAAGRLQSRSSLALESADDALARMDGIAQAEAVKQGDVSALELIDAAIARIERLNHNINAVVATDFERARSRAREGNFKGSFADVPFLVKDLDDFAGVRSSNGSRVMLANVPTETDPYIRACVDDGFNVVGKSNTPEFGLSGTTESLALGPCYNPWNLVRSAGGSSGGAGAAVAAGMVPVAQGSDGGGSIRIPASCCGVFGLKPSRGRMVGSNNFFGLAVRGVLSRSVRDSAYALAGTERSKPAPGLKPVGLVTEPEKRRLKIGIYLQGATGQPTTEVSQAIVSTARLCEELGHDVGIAQLEYDGRQFVADFLTLWASSAGRAQEAIERDLGRKVTHQDLEPLTLAFAEQYHSGGKEQIPAATKRLLEVSRRVNEQTKQFDVLLSPVLSAPPPVIGRFGPTVPFEQLIEAMIDYVAYTPLFNVTGAPAMSVPLYWTADGLPVGSQFAAKLGDEETLLSLAYELEAARPWADKWPPCSAVGARA